MFERKWRRKIITKNQGEFIIINNSNYIDINEFNKINNKFQVLFGCDLKIENNFIKLFYKNTEITNYDMKTHIFDDKVCTCDLDWSVKRNLFKPFQNFVASVEIIFKKMNINLFLDCLSLYVENKYSISKNNSDFPHIYALSKNDGLVEFILSVNENEKGIASPCSDIYYTTEELKEQIDIYEKAVELNKKYIKGV